MKQSFYSIIVFALLLTACQKQTTDSSPSEAPGVWGQMTAVRNTRIIVTDDDTATQTSELAFGYFYSVAGNPTNYTDVGNVNINDQALTRGANNIYAIESGSLGLHEKTRWTAPTVGTSQGLIFLDTTSYPQYLGAMPYTIDKSTGFSIQITDSNLFFSDSVRIYVSDGTGNTVVQRIFPASADVMTLTATDLAPLQTTNFHEGVVAIIPYHGRIAVIGKRAYFFTKETRVIQSVNIF